MKQAMRKQLSDLLDTIEEALDYLRGTESEEMRLLVSQGRSSVTQALEKGMNCSLEQRIHVSALTDEEWLLTARRMLDETDHPFPIRNAFDNEFQDILNFIWQRSEEELLEVMKEALHKLRDSSLANYDGFVQYFEKYPLWGTFRPDKGDWTTLVLRAAVLKRHSYDFLWLYRRLEDYLSKRTLIAILLNWLTLDLVELKTVKSIFPDYWEPDVFPDNRDDVLVDVGAYTGDSILAYAAMYGTNYRKIYAYEISPESCKMLREEIDRLGLHDVEVRQKGAGAARGEMYLNSSEADASANHLSDASSGERVEVVPLDEDVGAEMTFLKMDIEGAEQDALRGCAQTIRSRHPKLAICVYHGYEDIWKIPAMIDEMYSGYRFYLRHNGGNLIPTEFVLLCAPQ